MKTRAQAALEFLTTYGWAFLVILVMIGALAYFGVLDPQRFLPSRCQFETGWTCNRYVLNGDTDYARFEIKNDGQSSVTVSDIEFVDFDGDYSSCTTAEMGGVGVAGGQLFTKGTTETFYCEITDNLLIPQTKTKLQLRVLYNVGTTEDEDFQTYATGEIFAEVSGTP